MALDDNPAGRGSVQLWRGKALWAAGSRAYTPQHVIEAHEKTACHSAGLQRDCTPAGAAAATTAAGSRLAAPRPCGGWEQRLSD